jgi:phage shock protein PspC (stress-responsive transcriptional regulator)
MIAGVCAGIAEFLGWSVDRVRIAFGVITVFTGIVPGLVTYTVLCFLMPPADEDPPSFDLEAFRRQ